MKRKIEPLRKWQTIFLRKSKSLELKKIVGKLNTLQNEIK
jgi:hypothetical protein